MKKYLLILISLMVINPVDNWAQSIVRPIANPQLQMISARTNALGGTNPLLSGDISSVMINPASIVYTDTMSGSMSFNSVLTQYQYATYQFGMPIEIDTEFNDFKFNQTVYIGATYGNVQLGKIPNTVRTTNTIYSIGEYTAGFDVLAGTAGTVFYNLLGFSAISFGANGKLYRQYIKDHSRNALGIDVGASVSYNLDWEFVDSIHLSTSALNLASSSFNWAHSQEEALLPLNIFVGARADMFEDSLSVYVHNNDESFSLSSEYFFSETFVFRAGTDMKRLSFGTGLVMDQIAGVMNQQYNLRFDYTYKTNVAPFSMDPNHSITFTILGASQPTKPQILNPKEDLVIRENTINLNGVGPRSTTIRLYNNNELSRATQTNKFGIWTYNRFPLREGENTLFVRSYKIDQDLSQDSKSVMITKDTLPPDFIPTIEFTMNDKMNITINSDEVLMYVTGKLITKN